MAKSLRSVSIRITGLKETLGALRDFPIEYQRRILKKAVKAAAEPLIKKEVQLAPASQGRAARYRRAHGKIPLRDTIDMTVSAVREKRMAGDIARVVARIGPMLPAGAHGHLVEFGTVQRKTKKGRGTGTMPAHPFVRPAWNATQSQVETVLKAKLTEGVEAVAKQVAAKAGVGRGK